METITSLALLTATARLPFFNLERLTERLLLSETVTAADVDDDFTNDRAPTD